MPKFSLKGLATAACLTMATCGGAASGFAADLDATPAPRSFFATTEVQFLYGEGFHLGRKGFNGKNDRATVTVDHFSTWAYGETFFFADLFRDMDGPTAPGATVTDIYSEIYETFSLKALVGGESFPGLIRDVGPSFGINIGTNFLVGLYGGQVAFNMPGFDVFNLAAFAYDNIDDPFNRSLKTTYQLTGVWDTSFDISEMMRFRFKGFVDFIGKQKIRGGGPALKSQIVFQPQVRFDVGNLFGQRDRVWAGIEYAYFKNKFGVKNKDDNVVQAMLAIKLH